MQILKIFFLLSLLASCAEPLIEPEEVVPTPIPHHSSTAADPLDVSAARIDKHF